VNKVIVFSRDELKQFEMQKRIDKKYLKNLRFFLGDVRDKNRLRLAFQNVDLVVHAAALKQVPAAEYNPFEFIQTNVVGAQNIIETCLDYSSKVQNIIALSTDKASSPINLYGATKLCSDKIFVTANNIKGDKKVKFSIVRYGNVMGSRGSVLHSFLEQAKKGTIEITHKEMTRFNIILDEAIKIVLEFFLTTHGGEIFVPKLNSFKVLDLAMAVGKNCKIKYTGIRPGETLHEEMISINDSLNTFEMKDKYLICNETNKDKIFNHFLKKTFIKKVDKKFSYSSEINQFLSIEQIKKIVLEHKLIKI
jgi:FlaA1/EpsC-like NDP-sugar epimerase